MKTLATLALAACVFVAGSAQAAAEPGDLGLFAVIDDGGTPAYETTFNPTPNVPFTAAAVAFDTPGGVFAYEVGVTVPAGLFQLSASLAGPGPLNVGDASIGNFIVGSGGCIEDTAGPLQLVTLSLLPISVAPDTAILLGGTTPSSFDGIPGYVECALPGAGPEVPFTTATNGDGRYPDGALILNATTEGPVDNDQESFGSVKARF